MIHNMLRRCVAAAATVLAVASPLSAGGCESESGFTTDPTVKKKCKTPPKTVKKRPGSGTVVGSAAGRYGADCKDRTYLTVKTKTGKRVTFAVGERVWEKCVDEGINEKWRGSECR